MDGAGRAARPVVGVRPGDAPAGPLVWADPAGVPLAVGDWVVVADPDEWVGVVIVAPEQVVESALANPLPLVVRQAGPDERPVGAPTAGAALLGSLDLPDWAVRPPGPAGRGPSAGDDGDEGEEQGERSGRD